MSRTECNQSYEVVVCALHEYDTLLGKQKPSQNETPESPTVPAFDLSSFFKFIYRETIKTNARITEIC